MTADLDRRLSDGLARFYDPEDPRAHGPAAVDRRLTYPPLA